MPENSIEAIAAVEAARELLVRIRVNQRLVAAADDAEIERLEQWYTDHPDAELRELGDILAATLDAYYGRFSQADTDARMDYHYEALPSSG